MEVNWLASKNLIFKSCTREPLEKAGYEMGRRESKKEVLAALEAAVKDHNESIEGAIVPADISVRLLFARTLEEASAIAFPDDGESDGLPR